MIAAAAAHFAVPGTLAASGRFGSGLINDTFLCEFSDAGVVRKYVLQRINRNVFTQPDLVMENVEIVTAHIQERLRREGEAAPEDRTPALVRTRDNRSFHRDSAGDIWRMFHFIGSGEVFDRVTGPEHAEEIGRALGRFQALAADLSPDRLHDTLPGFHHTPRYLSQFDAAVQADIAGRMQDVRAEVGFVQQRRPLAPLLTDLLRDGVVPVRVVHNDPKVNNVLVHRRTGEAICMLDLDTVKAGTVLFDFGDCVRSAANPAGEDAEQLEDVRLDAGLYEAVLRGYLREAGQFLTRSEVKALPLSVRVITFELGLRFLTDHLRGDVYFRTAYPGHNLHRARVQFRLLESIEAAGSAMEEAVRTFTA